MSAENEMDTTTFEDVEKTAKEFDRVAIRLAEHHVIIVMDDMIIGKDFIKQFDDTPIGYAYARRWAVRMRDPDEVSDQPFEELRSEYLVASGRSHEEDTRPTVSSHDTTHYIR